MNKRMQEYQMQRQTQARIDRLMGQSRDMKRRYRSLSANLSKRKLSRTGDMNDTSSQQLIVADVGRGQAISYTSPVRSVHNSPQKHINHSSYLTRSSEVLSSSQNFDMIDPSLFRYAIVFLVFKYSFIF